MVSGVVPYTLENRTRICFPPIDTRTICRSVESVKPGRWRRIAGSSHLGDVAHVPTQ